MLHLLKQESLEEHLQSQRLTSGSFCRSANQYSMLFGGLSIAFMHISQFAFVKCPICHLQHANEQQEH